MKKIIGLACLLVIVAALVVPMAASAATTTPVSGTIKAATVTMTAPKPVAFGQFTMGWNIASNEDEASLGTVAVTPGTSGLTNWTVTAAWGRYMRKGTTGSVYLAWPLLGTGVVGTWDDSPWPPTLYSGDGTTEDVVTGEAPFASVTLGGPLTYSGTTAEDTFCFGVAQFIDDADVATLGQAGAYAATVTFTATCDP
jgi:hypothetical protein